MRRASAFYRLLGCRQIVASPPPLRPLRRRRADMTLLDRGARSGRSRPRPANIYFQCRRRSTPEVEPADRAPGSRFDAMPEDRRLSAGASPRPRDPARQPHLPLPRPARSGASRPGGSMEYIHRKETGDSSFRWNDAAGVPRLARHGAALLQAREDPSRPGRRASTRRAARRWPGRWSRRRWCSTATASRAASTIQGAAGARRARRSARGSTRWRVIGVGIASVEEIDRLNIYLGADAGDEPGGRRARPRSGDGAGRRQSLPALGAAVGGDRRRRRQMPLDRRRLDRRQGDPRPDHGRPCARASRLWLGDQQGLSDARALSRRSTRSARRRSTAAASRRSANYTLDL